MAAALASALITEMRYTLKDSNTTDPNYTDPEMLNVLNDSVEALVRHITAHWPQYWLRTGETSRDIQNLVSGTSNYDLPALMYFLIRVVTLDSDDVSTPREQLDFDRHLDDQADGYRLFDDDIYLYPTPDEDVANGLLLYYIPQQTRMTLVGDSVLLSDHWRQWLKDYGVIRLRDRQEESVAQMGQLFKRVDSEMNVMMAKANKPDGWGWRIGRRLWM